MRHFLLILTAFASAVAFGQKKPNINKAKASFDKGELAEAKAMIDQAIEYEKTKDNPKTWYYRGMIYSSIDTSTNDPEAMRVAMESFRKSLELDPAQKSTTEFTGTGLDNVDSKIQNYYGFYYNQAITDYQEKTFESATENFEKAFFIFPSDSNAILNAAYSATAAGFEERANENYKKALEAGVTDIGVYLRLYNYAIGKEDLDGAYAILDDARAVHPNNVEIMKYQINILIQQEKIDEAKVGIEKAIAKEPNNPDLHFSLGVIEEEQENLEAAKASYTNAINIDSEHYNSNFNLGVMVFNECNVLIKERSALSYKEDKKIAALSIEIDERLNDALPYWEKLYSLRDNESTILETLQYIYLSLKMNDKAEEISTKLDNLKGE
ncbi:MAG: tetratricopeptide repeat protein [Cyclobacteriaceae bacterium]